MCGVGLFWALAGCWAWVGYALAVVLLGVRVRLSVRLAVASVAALWLLAVVFQLTLHLHVFNRTAVSLVWGAAGAGLFLVPGLRARVAEAGRRDRQRIALAAARLRRNRVAWLLLAPLAAAGYRFWLALPEPPLAWDALTYHLLKAGRWVQNGHLSPEAAPNAWSYYEYFPPVGDCYWAWAMLPTSDDSMLAFANLAVWLAGLLTAYALTRHFGGHRTAAVGAAVAVGFAPAVFNQIVSSYVDNLLLALVMGGLLFLDRAWRMRQPPDAALACAAFGLAVGTKSSALALAVPAAAVLAGRFLLWRPSGAIRTTMARTLACFLPLLVAAPAMIRSFIERGSPLYPFQVRIAGFLLPGNEQLAWVLAGKPESPGAVVAGVESVASTLLGVCIGFNIGATQILGFGSIPVILLAGGSVLVSRRELFTRAALCMIVLLIAVPLLSDTVQAYRQVWKNTLPRFLMPGYGVLVAWLAARGKPWGFVVVLLAAQLNFVSMRFTDWEPAHTELAAEAGLAAAILAFVFGAVRLLRLSPARGRQVMWLSLLLVVVALCARLAPLREKTRDHFYQAAARRAGGNERKMLEYWPIWKSVDGIKPLRIAVTAGWTGNGHNVFAYPLLGSRLQNQVGYVPISADGTVSNYLSIEEQRERGDYKAWLERLRERRIDIVVAYGPMPLEMVWMQEHPEHFEFFSQSVDGTSQAFRFRGADRKGEA